MVTIVYTCTGQVGFSGSPIMHRQTHRQLVYYLGGSAGFGQSCDGRDFLGRLLGFLLVESLILSSSETEF